VAQSYDDDLIYGGESLKVPKRIWDARVSGSCFRTLSYSPRAGSAARRVKFVIQFPYNFRTETRKTTITN
jgi:hypothetical protein